MYYFGIQHYQVICDTEAELTFEFHFFDFSVWPFIAAMQERGVKVYFEIDTLTLSTYFPKLAFLRENKRRVS